MVRISDGIELEQLELKRKTTRMSENPGRMMRLSYYEGLE